VGAAAGQELAEERERVAQVGVVGLAGAGAVQELAEEREVAEGRVLQ